MSSLSFSKATSALFVAALFAGLAFAPFGGAQAPLVDTSLGFAYDENFDTSDGGMSASGPVGPERPHHTDVWEWGAPTSGPGFADSGSNVWGTRLAGPYAAYDCGAILSPPIDLTNATSASVSFDQWRHMQQFATGSKWTYDAGMVFVTADGGATLSAVAPDTGYDGLLQSYSSRCHDGLPSGSSGHGGIGGPSGSTPPAAVYSPLAFDLTPFLGQVVQVAISFGSDGSTHYAGWYIDDFAVTIDGVQVVEDFESSDGGFTHATTYMTNVRHGWGWDVPAPGGPGSESPMWATNPYGHSGHNECAALDTPAIELSPAGGLALPLASATLTWNQWHRSNSLYGAGVVLIGSDATGWEVLTPEGGYPGTIGSTYRDQLVACLGVDGTQRVFSGLHDAIGGPMRPMRADLTPWMGQDVTVRFLFATAWSVFGPTTNPGWYVDDLAVELRAVVGDPGVEGLVGDLLDRTPLSPNAMPTGWTSGGKDSTWAFGVATRGPEGMQALATNLTGTHKGAECSWVQTPAVPGSLLALDPTLRFDQWYDIYKGSTASSTWSGAAVMASTDGGATWQYLALPEYDSPARAAGSLELCMKGIDPTFASGAPVFTGANRFWETVTVDVSSLSGASTVEFRFVFGSGISILRDGWYLGNVEVGGVDVL